MNKQEFKDLIYKEYWLESKNCINSKSVKAKKNESILDQLILFTSFLDESASVGERFYYLQKGFNEPVMCSSPSCTKLTTYQNGTLGHKDYCSYGCFQDYKKLSFKFKIKALPDYKLIPAISYIEFKSIIDTHFLKDNKLIQGISSSLGMITFYPEIAKYVWDYSFIKTDSVKELIYISYYQLKSYPQCECGNRISKFKSFSDGYNQFCSPKCASIYTKDKREQTCLEKYGTKNPLQAEEVKAKIKESLKSVDKDVIKKKKEDTYFSKTGYKYSSQNPAVIAQRADDYFIKTGYRNPSQNPEVKEKAKKTRDKWSEEKKQSIIQAREDTYFEKTGYRNPAQNPNVKLQMKETNLDKRDVEYPTQASEVMELQKLTNIERFGEDCLFKTSSFKEHAIEESYKNFGTPHPMKNKDFAKKVVLKNIVNGNGVHSLNLFSNREKVSKTNLKTFYQSLLETERLQGKVIPLFSEESYEGTSKQYLWECTSCHTNFYSHINLGIIPRCPTCYPSNKSMGEQEVFLFVQNLVDTVVESGNRTVLNGKELDIYVPELNFAIEYNGLYYHSESYGKGSDYHLQKTVSCQEKGIKLIHIFEDEWFYKKDIVKSIIRANLGIPFKKIFGRKCNIKTIASKEASKFYATTHLQGEINSKVNLGLFYNKQLVSCLSFSKPRYNKKYNWEITRYSTLLNTSVYGGFAKLLNHFEKHYTGSIITYSDRRWFTGEVYMNNGFSALSSSKPNYFYNIDGHRESRVKYQKHKLKFILEDFDSNLTEYENMLKNGYDRIWDCGNLAFSKYNY